MECAMWIDVVLKSLFDISLFVECCEYCGEYCGFMESGNMEFGMWMEREPIKDLCKTQT